MASFWKEDFLMALERLATAKDLNEYVKQAAKAVIAVAKTKKIALIGIQMRGVPLAERIGRLVESESDIAPALGKLDINFYRDDLSQVAQHPVLRKTEIPFSLDDQEVFLIDDVLYTGRTIRAALDAMVDFGRPARVSLLVLVDRGGRELPIQADWAALSRKVPKEKNIQVKLKECDGEDGIDLL